MATKICSKCGLEKDENEFAWHWYGLRRHSACNDCRRKAQRDYYERTKEHPLEYKYNRQADEREEARHYVYEYLQEHPCVDCGESDPMVLTFDHVRGRKKMNISQMVNQGYSLEAIQEEIDKCEVVCANDHMRREKKDVVLNTSS